MFNLLKRKKDSATPVTSAEETPPTKLGLFDKLKLSLAKTRSHLSNGLANIFLGKKVLDQEVLDHLETQLLTADIGIDATSQLINHLTEKLARNELQDTAAALVTLQTDMKEMLRPCEVAFNLPEKTTSPFIILVVGINGSGKTTTIGKLAKHFQNQGKKVMLAAGDTFRAAATQQLQVWGERNNIPVVAQHSGADTAAVIYDAFESAKAKQMDILIADTAGRLHTQTNLMDELKKVKRVLAKIDPTAPHETLLILDASIGQNALNQAKQFHEAVGVTGLAITKLDGTAKGGIIFAIAKLLKLPIRFIGIGEGIDDLRPFSVDEFVTALFE
jgi:fused signal recognition particle receptor